MHKFFQQDQEEFNSKTPSRGDQFKEAFSIFTTKLFGRQFIDISRNSTAELGQILRSFGASPSEAVLTQIVAWDIPEMKKGLDASQPPDFKNRVDFWEFLTIMARLSFYEEEQSEELRTAFNTFAD